MSLFLSLLAFITLNLLRFLQALLLILFCCLLRSLSNLRHLNWVGIKFADWRHVCWFDGMVEAKVGGGLSYGSGGFHFYILSFDLRREWWFCSPLQRYLFVITCQQFWALIIPAHLRFFTLLKNLRILFDEIPSIFLNLILMILIVSWHKEYHVLNLKQLLRLLYLWLFL